MNAFVHCGDAQGRTESAEMRAGLRRVLSQGCALGVVLLICTLLVGCDDERATGASVAARQRVAERFVQAGLDQRPLAVLAGSSADGFDPTHFRTFLGGAGVGLSPRPVFHRPSCRSFDGDDCFEFILKSAKDDPRDWFYTLIVSVTKSNPPLVDGYNAAGGNGRDEGEGLNPIIRHVGALGSRGGLALRILLRIKSDPSYAWVPAQDYASVSGGQQAAHTVFRQFTDRLASNATVEPILVDGKEAGSMVDVGSGAILKLLAPGPGAPTASSCPDAWAVDFPGFRFDNLDHDRFKMYFCER